MKKIRCFMRLWLSIPLLAYSAISFSGEVDGVLQWHQKADLSLPVSGVIAEVNVVAGQKIKRGTIMLKLDPRRFQSRVKAAKARMAQHVPGRNEAKNELARAEELFDRTVLSQVELDQAQIDFAEKDAHYLEARAVLEEAQLDLEYSALKAPFDLQVIDIPVVQGQTVVNQLQATPLVTVVSGDLVAVSEMPSSKAAGLQQGKSVTVNMNRVAYSGKVSVLDYDADTQQMRAIVKLDKASQANVGQVVKVTW